MLVFYENCISISSLKKSPWACILLGLRINQFFFFSLISLNRMPNYEKKSISACMKYRRLPQICNSKIDKHLKLAHYHRCK